MFIKVTHKGKPTLLNTNNIVTMFNGYDKVTSRKATTITFTNSNTLFIDESLEEVYDIIARVMSGEKQTIDWTYQQQPFDERMERSYAPRPHYNRREEYNQW